MYPLSRSRCGRSGQTRYRVIELKKKKKTLPCDINPEVGCRESKRTPLSLKFSIILCLETPPHPALVSVIGNGTPLSMLLTCGTPSILSVMVLQNRFWKFLISR